MGKRDKILKDIYLLSKFTETFCLENHNGEKALLNLKGILGDYLNGYKLKVCDECKRVLLHGVAKRLLCPYDPKPPCKKCPTPCYRKGYREKMREIMKFSGMYFIKKGKLSYVFKYFF